MPCGIDNQRSKLSYHVVHGPEQGSRVKMYTARSEFFLPLEMLPQSDLTVFARDERHTRQYELRLGLRPYIIAHVAVAISTLH